MVIRKQRTIDAAVISLAVSSLASLWANPILTPGVWTNITPPGLYEPAVQGPPFGCVDVELDPSNSSTLWVGTDMEGIWKSTDGGSTWALHNGNLSSDIGGAAINIDPNNSNHLYLSSDVRGSHLGFWVSTDGGDTWAYTPSFANGVTNGPWNNDCYVSDVDPTDFNHLFLCWHSPWNWTSGVSGFIETTDGGNSWKVYSPVPGGGYGSQLVQFLWDTSLAHSQGNGKTWLFNSPNGMWRTTDGGADWTQLNGLGSGHGGAMIYYAKTGVLYSGGNNQMQRSTDNGVTWAAIGPRYQDQYYCIIGDGNLLYAQAGNTGNNTIGLQPYICSPETDGVNWSAYNPLNTGAQTFRNGPYRMRFDKVNRIIYSANWNAGVWALKVLDPAPTGIVARSAATGKSIARDAVFHSLQSRGMFTVRAAALLGSVGGEFDVGGRAVVQKR
jgi:hypothetical protein